MELLGGRPFFKGRDYVDQLNQILHILGTPNEETLCRIGSPRAQEYIRSLPFMPKKPFPQLFPNANPDALDLLDYMLAFDPSSRISVEAALEHPYLQVWHDASDEPGCPTTFNFDFEVVEDVGEMRKMILDEVYSFRQQVRIQPGQQKTAQGPTVYANSRQFERDTYHGMASFSQDKVQALIWGMTSENKHVAHDKLFRLPILPISSKH